MGRSAIRRRHRSNIGKRHTPKGSRAGGANALVARVDLGLGADPGAKIDLDVTDATVAAFGVTDFNDTISDNYPTAPRYRDDTINVFGPDLNPRLVNDGFDPLPDGFWEARVLVVPIKSTWEAFRRKASEYVRQHYGV